ncbi:Elongation factor P isoform B [Glycine soja]|uniref:Elongation factor P isoform B n=1 Tax=Glycine soja TaxID=3848 RepID=A0A445FVU7_GLYSO|nr:Elongation factor P isoform B [Glycine soja]
MVAGTATLKLSLSAFSSPMSNFSASSSFPSLLPMRTPSSSKPRFLSESLRSLISMLSLTTLRFSLTCAFLSGIYALTSNDIKVGTNLEVDGAPWRVLEFLHVKPGKGAAFVRTKMKNYITGNTVEKTFRAGSSIEQADVFKETKQFTYKDGAQFVFMDLNTYEEFRLGEKEIGDRTKWLKEGMDCNLLLWNGKVIDVELPITIKLAVVDVDPGLKGDTAQGGGTKPATLDTGAVVNVPLFVNVGDEILVDSRTGQYMSRA